MNTEISQLPQKAREINEQHQLCEEHLQSGLVHALNAGKLLTEAKEALPHGRFIRWAKDNCQFSLRTAQLYMRAANRWPEIEAIAQHVAPLSLRNALDLIAEHHPQPEMGGDLIPPPGHMATAELETPAGVFQVLIHRHTGGEHAFTTTIEPNAETGYDRVGYVKRAISKSHQRHVLQEMLPDGKEVDELEWEVAESGEWEGYHPCYQPYWRHREPLVDDATGEIAALEQRIAEATYGSAEKMDALHQFGERGYHTACGFDSILSYASERHDLTVNELNGMLGIGAA